MSLESYVQAAPKAELHVHLEGAIQHQITDTEGVVSCSRLERVAG